MSTEISSPHEELMALGVWTGAPKPARFRRLASSRRQVQRIRRSRRQGMHPHDLHHHKVGGV
jgi:hypothetical protein